MAKTKKITKIVIECGSCGADIETSKISGKVQCGNKLSDGSKCGERTKI